MGRYAAGASTAPSCEFNGKSKFRGDELVMATPYERLVMAQLRAWHALPEPAPERDARLRMTRVKLDASAGVRHLRAFEPGLYEKAAADADAEGLTHVDLDILLRCLRTEFARAHSGWVPTFGKNRVVERLRGSYVVDGGGRGGLSKTKRYVVDGGGRGRRSAVRHQVGKRERLPGAGVRVGIVDTGLFPHPWLAGAYLAFSSDLVPDGPVDHATFVAGMVLRQAPGALLEVRAGLDDQATSDTWTIAKTVADLASGGADVVNLSFGCTTEDQRAPLVLRAAVDALPDRTVVVAAAGNHNEPGKPAEPVWPAALDDVIAVGALDGAVPADFSPSAPWVDAMAQGVDVVSTCNPAGKGEFFGRWSGTSFAAAAVTGTIAAGIDQSTTPRAAWEALQPGNAPAEKPVIALRDLPGWPPSKSGW